MTGFAPGDTIDLPGWQFGGDLVTTSPVSVAYTQQSGGAGTLVVSQISNDWFYAAVGLDFAGDYTKFSFFAADDGHGGTLVTLNAGGTVTLQAAGIAAELDTLEAQVLAGQVGQIVLSDIASPIAITQAQSAGDADALAVISGGNGRNLGANYYLDVGGASVQQALAEQGQENILSFGIADTAANVLAGLDGLESLAAAGRLGSITLTDAGTPALPLTLDQATTYAAVLAKLTGNYALLEPASAAQAVAAGTAPHVVWQVTDSASDVVINLDGLQALAMAGQSGRSRSPAARRRPCRSHPGSSPRTGRPSPPSCRPLRWWWTVRPMTGRPCSRSARPCATSCAARPIRPPCSPMPHRSMRGRWGCPGWWRA